MYKISSNIKTEKVDGRNSAFTVYHFSTEDEKITLSFKAIEYLNKNDLFIDDFCQIYYYKNNLTHYISDIKFEKDYCEKEVVELCIDNSFSYNDFYTYCLSKLELLKRKTLELNKKQYFEFRKIIDKVTIDFDLNKNQEKIIVLKNKLDSEIKYKTGLNPPFYSSLSYYSKNNALKEVFDCTLKSKNILELYKKNQFFTNKENLYSLYKFNKQVHLNRINIFKKSKDKKMFEKETLFLKEKNFSDFITIKDKYIDIEFMFYPDFSSELSFCLNIRHLESLEYIFNVKKSKTFHLLKNLLFQKIEKEFKENSSLYLMDKDLLELHYIDNKRTIISFEHDIYGLYLKNEDHLIIFNKNGILNNIFEIDFSQNELKSLLKKEISLKINKKGIF
tara:strand:+ start:18246 stop:19415 length:1170 start_codon:yes stop_codon:yes gene_type:complete